MPSEEAPGESAFRPERDASAEALRRAVIGPGLDLAIPRVIKALRAGLEDRASIRDAVAWHPEGAPEREPTSDEAESDFALDAIRSIDPAQLKERLLAEAEQGDDTLLLALLLRSESAPLRIVSLRERVEESRRLDEIGDESGLAEELLGQFEEDRKKVWPIENARRLALADSRRYGGTATREYLFGWLRDQMRDWPEQAPDGEEEEFLAAEEWKDRQAVERILDGGQQGEDFERVIKFIGYALAGSLDYSPKLLAGALAGDAEDRRALAERMDGAGDLYRLLGAAERLYPESRAEDQSGGEH